MAVVAVAPIGPLGWELPYAKGMTPFFFLQKKFKVLEENVILINKVSAKKLKL